MSASRRPRLLFVGAFPPRGSKVFGGNVTDCRVLLDAGLPDAFELSLIDSTQRSVPPPWLGRRVLDSVSRVWGFVRQSGHPRPDAVLLLASSGLSFVEKALYAAYAEWRGVPSMLFVRSGHFQERCRNSGAFAGIARRLLRAPTIVLAQGASWQRFFTETLDVPAARCAIVENWVATSDLVAIGATRQERSSGPVRLLFVGWLDVGKGIFELLDAISRLAQTAGVPPFELQIAGRGTAERRVHERVAERQLNDRVKFLGWVAGGERLAMYRDADVFVLPSYAEGLPNSMIEAMAAALPVVVTPVGSIPDVIRDGETGMLVPPRDTAALAGALSRLITDRVFRERLGRAAFEETQPRFSPARAIGDLVALVRRISDSDHRASGSYHTGSA